MHTHVAYASRTILDSFSQGQKEMILPEYQTKPLIFSKFCIMEVIQQHSLNLSRPLFSMESRVYSGHYLFHHSSSLESGVCSAVLCWDWMEEKLAKGDIWECPHVMEYAWKLDKNSNENINVLYH